MSYTPTNWKDGDLVTSAKLNKMEQGIANGGGVLAVHADENGKLDKTWQEIYDAGLAVIQSIEDDYKYITPIDRLFIDNNTYYVSYGQTFYSTSSPDDYPVYNEETGGGTK